MKRLLITICAALAILGAAAQQVAPKQQTASPARIPTPKEVVTQPQQKQQPQFTGLYYPAPDGKLYPAFRGSKGGIFVERISKKSGQPYRQYLNDKQKLKLIKK